MAFTWCSVTIEIFDYKRCLLFLLPSVTVICSGKEWWRLHWGGGQSLRKATSMKTLLSFALGEALCLFWPLKGGYFCQQNRASLQCQGFVIPEEGSCISGQLSIFPSLCCCDNLCSTDSLHLSWHFTLSAGRAWCAAAIPQHFHSCPAILLPMNPESLPSSGEVISIGLCLSQIICVRWSCSMQVFL